MTRRWAIVIWNMPTVKQICRTSFGPMGWRGILSCFDFCSTNPSGKLFHSLKVKKRPWENQLCVIYLFVMEEINLAHSKWHAMGSYDRTVSPLSWLYRNIIDITVLICCKSVIFFLFTERQSNAQRFIKYIYLSFLQHSPRFSLLPWAAFLLLFPFLLQLVAWVCCAGLAETYGPKMSVKTMVIPTMLAVCKFRKVVSEKKNQL